MIVARDFDMALEGEAGRARLAAAARILRKSISSAQDQISLIDIPNYTRTLLGHIENGEGCNDSAHPIPEVSRVQVSVHLEDSIV